ncbi:hypothetical protein [Kribbella sp. NPDC048915]|uniref:hypothetical protein n=1 Tax=Kribbella sp. NPDC048915 TaxID=3155148 RepID=UPI0033F0CDC7
MVSHQSALVLHGVRVSELDLQRVHVTRRAGAGRSDRSVCQHAASPPVDAIAELGGVRTTAPARAVVETTRATGYPTAVAVVDQSLRLGIATPPELADALERFARRSGIRTAQRAVEFADGRAESVGESWLRVTLSELGLSGLGLSAPLLQDEIYDENGTFVARVDFLFVRFGLIVEFDGAVKYGDAPRGTDRGEDPRGPPPRPRLSSGPRHLAHHGEPSRAPHQHSPSRRPLRTSSGFFHRYRPITRQQSHKPSPGWALLNTPAGLCRKSAGADMFAPVRSAVRCVAVSPDDRSSR